MKFTAFFLLVAASHAAELRASRNKENTQEDKRSLVEVNANIDKRAPAISTVAPPVTPGIEYAATKDAHQDRSPSQQIYATPVPQIAKISDVLTGQGPPFQAAIASHLYAPVSIYQPRLGSPTTYEISPPIQSQLAYSEHKISYQPPQNAIQYTPQTQYEQTAKLVPLNQVNLQRVNQQQQYQQIFVQPQPIVYSQRLGQPQQISAYQPLSQISYQPRLAVPQNEILRPIQYIQSASPSVAYLRQQPQTPQTTNSVPVIQAQKQLVLAAQPGITYVQKSNVAQSQPAAQAVLPTPVPRQAKEVEKDVPESQQQQQQATIPYLRTPAPIAYAQPQQAVAYTQPQEPIAYAQPQGVIYLQSQGPLNYNDLQGAISFASFSQSQPAPANQQKPREQPQYQTVQYQAPQSLLVKAEATQTSSQKSAVQKPVPYLRQRTALPQAQPIQPQVYSQDQLLLPNTNYISSALSETPSFPPVQYFGKFAPSIFSRYRR
ncbi:neuronal PAS domain-containing protein 2-like [Achroia grisella]|uniref:neuronal PAS domain-containing protein 2-like n=1 Tax=Achroia grisella TaxID=688607 RepID=UPI0027D33620|nr:neuronal PAS domain-containing protein 2-like [Achroia grisella]